MGKQLTNWSYNVESNTKRESKEKQVQNYHNLPWAIFLLSIDNWQSIFLFGPCTRHKASINQIITNHWCVLCKNSNKTRDLLFLYCHFAATSWSRLLKEFGIFWVWPCQCQDIFQHVMGTFGFGRRRKKFWNWAFLAIFWSLWERNKRIFDNEKGDCDFLQDKMKYWMALWVYNTKELKDLSFADLIRDWNIWFFSFCSLLFFCFLLF